MPPVVYGLRSGSTALPNNALITGPATTSASCSTSCLASKQPRPTRIATFLPRLMISDACSSNCVSGGLDQ